MNSYSYARNNPLKYVDQNGNFAFLAPLAIGAVAATPYLAVIAHAIPAYIDNWQTTVSSLPGTGDVIHGLRVTNHAVEGFVERNIKPSQVGVALKEGVKYIDTKTNNLLHVVGERGKGGYTIFTYQELSNKIYEVFVKSFNEELAGTKEKYDLIAKNFLNRINKK